MVAERRLRLPTLLALVTASGAACGGMTGVRAPCVAVSPTYPLSGVPESSGIVPSHGFPGVFWTHNDSEWDAVLFAVDSEGQPVGEVRVSGAENVDWEDLDIAQCEQGSCLYISDTGDNAERRPEVRLYRVPEPAPDAGVTAPADVFPLRLPDGPRDIEAAFVIPPEQLYFVTKGRNHRVALYRYPGPLPEGPPGSIRAPVTLERVQYLTRRSPFMPRHVTGAGATDDGSIVAVRTYETLLFYRWDAGRLVPIRGGFVSLRSVREQQGEAVALLPGNRVVLTSEAGPLGERGSMIFLRCSIPGVEW